MAGLVTGRAMPPALSRVGRAESSEDSVAGVDAGTTGAEVEAAQPIAKRTGAD